MARPLKPYPLSKMSGGTNRFVQEAQPNQTVDADNVVQDDGDLRRRDAFAAFQSAAPHFLPAGQVAVKSYRYSTQVWTDWTNRQLGGGPAFSSYGLTGTRGRLFIGCDSEFQGFHWGALDITSAGFGSADQQYLRIRFVTSNWVDSDTPANDESLFETASWVLDTTTRVEDSSADKIQPLTQDGYICWHKSQQPSTWAAKTVDSTSKYWIIVDFADTPLHPDDGTSDSDATDAWPSAEVFNIEAPGIRCFQLKPVTGLFPLFNRTSGDLVIASCPSQLRGQESGPQVGVSFNEKQATRPIGFEKDWGTGFLGQVTAGSSGASGDTAAGNTTATGFSGWSANKGTADKLTKTDESYDWRAKTSGTPPANHGQWSYPELHTAVAPTGSPTTTSFTFTLANSYNNEFEDCVFVVTTSGSGPTVGAYNRCTTSTVSGTTVTVTFDTAWNAAPTTSSRFTILGVPHFLTTLQKHVDPSVNELAWNPRFEICSTDSAHVLNIRPQSLTGNLMDDREDVQDVSIDDEVVQFSIQREARYELPFNEYADYCFDEVTRRFIFAFGNYPLQSWDGRRFRELAALSDASDLAVQSWTGFVSEQYAGDQQDPGYVRAAFLRAKPPAGQFVTAFSNRIYVAGLPGDPSRVVYSAPGSFNDIWPKGYETLVRNPSGAPITGISHLNDELVVFTRDGIWATPQPDELGYTNLTPRSQGIGFINNRVVQQAAFRGSSMLIGANADGIYGYTGAEPTSLMGDWEGIIDGGVNPATMHRACAAVSFYENAYYLAVPSQFAEYPDKIVRYDYSDGTVYVWSAPYGGVTAMALNRDDNGNEMLIFGHEDGTVSRLIPNKTDDGTTITGYARTPPFTAGGLTMAISGYMVTMENLGDTETVTINEYPNEDTADPNALYAGTFDAGIALDFGNIELLNEKKKTKRINAKSGTRCESVQLEITGTSQWRLRNLEILMNPLGQRSK